MNLVDYLINSFKMMSDETRLRIIMLLSQRKLCVCQMCKVLCLSQPKISKHLAKLRAMDYVIDERREQYIYYRLNIKDNNIAAFINSILANIDEYSILQQDQEKLVDVDKIIEQCNL